MLQCPPFSDLKFPTLRYVDKMAAVEGGKCPSVHTQVLDSFECATEVGLGLGLGLGLG